MHAILTLVIGGRRMVASDAAPDAVPDSLPRVGRIPSLSAKSRRLRLDTFLFVVRHNQTCASCKQAFDIDQDFRLRTQFTQYVATPDGVQTQRLFTS
jgi:hypothetical protein